MGCHTWFYKKVDPQPTYEEVKTYVIDRIKKEIDFDERLISDRNSFDSELLETYPEWTSEHGQYCKEINERKLRIVSSNYCKLAVCNKYKYNDNLTIYIEGKGFYVYSHDLPHDIFRKYGYPDDKLFSLQETLDYINNIENQCTVYDYTVQKLTEFWTKYPDGVIKFG
jgi:hypothetical protein